MLATMAVRTSTTPGVWAAELERDERSFWTVASIFREQDEERQR